MPSLNNAVEIIRKVSNDERKLDKINSYSHANLFKSTESTILIKNTIEKSGS